MTKANRPFVPDQAERTLVSLGCNTVMPRTRPAISSLAIALAASAALPAPHALGAQTSTASTGDRRNVLSVNPLGIPFEYISAEYEGVVSKPFTLGGNVSYATFSDYTYSSFELKGRLYPGEEAPKGFSVGLGAGLSNIRGQLVCFDNCSDGTRTHPSVHVFVDYNWLLGKGKRFFVGTGVGAKRIFGGIDREFSNADAVYPTVRFQLGTNF